MRHERGRDCGAGGGEVGGEGGRPVWETNQKNGKGKKVKGGGYGKEEGKIMGVNGEDKVEERRKRKRVSGREISREKGGGERERWRERGRDIERGRGRWEGRERDTERGGERQSHREMERWREGAGEKGREKEGEKEDKSGRGRE